MKIENKNPSALRKIEELILDRFMLLRAIRYVFFRLGEIARNIPRSIGRGEREISARLQIMRPTGLFQPYGYTSMERHRLIFEAMMKLPVSATEQRFLSFGCSTGEEAFRLAELFPKSRVEGVDISRTRIRAASTRLRDNGTDRIAFRCTDEFWAAPPEAYDAILALSVFRHGGLNPAPATCDHLLRFADFENLTRRLAQRIKPGGLFIIRHANFAFSDTRQAMDFTPLFNLPRSADSPLYGPDNRLRRDFRDEQVIFQKNYEL